MTGTQNGSPRRWPDFIHVGPPRTGTTWLHEVLSGHCGLPSFKETHYFDSEYNRGEDWYLGLFQSPDQSLPKGEFDPTYFSNPLARERIRKHIPDCKILCTFRDPTERLYSHYRLVRRKRRPVYDTFEKHWRSILLSGSDVANYATQLRHWQRTFGDRNLLVLFYDDLVKNPQGYLDRVCDFVKIARVPLDQSPVGDSEVFSAPAAARSNSLSRRSVMAIDWLGKHGGAKLVQMGKNTRLRKKIRELVMADFEALDPVSANELRAVMLSETEELERITGRDLTNWKPARKLSDKPHEGGIRLSAD